VNPQFVQVYLATICLQFLHLIISVFPHSGHRNLPIPLSFDILLLHDVHFSMFLLEKALIYKAC